MICFAFLLAASIRKNVPPVIAQTAGSGDFNGDYQINLTDAQLLSAKLGTSHCPFNMTGDCMIDLYDYNQLAAKVGTVLTPPTPILSLLPESTKVTCDLTQTKPARSINVGTQNFGLDRGDIYRPALTVPQIMEKYDLDIMAIQEFYRYGGETGPDGLMIIMSRLYPGKTVYYNFSEAWMSVGIVSKFPMVEKSIGIVEERQIAHAKIRTPYGDIRVFSWHAKRDNSDGQNACRYNRGAYDYMRTVIQPGDKVVIMGDFNATKERIFGECGGNPTELFKPNCAPGVTNCYQGSDFFAGVYGPQVHSICNQGNFFNFVDGHNLNAATVILN